MGGTCQNLNSILTFIQNDFDSYPIQPQWTIYFPRHIYIYIDILPFINPQRAFLIVRSSAVCCEYTQRTHTNERNGKKRSNMCIKYNARLADVFICLHRMHCTTQMIVWCSRLIYIYSVLNAPPRAIQLTSVMRR